ncbi:MAG: VCBS repeat-containing protein [Myxococcaceae bacterium]|nr:VCBS repeat-containing protein [Myxococcaceae bacterium]
MFSGIAETLPHAFTTGLDPRFWAVDVTGDGLVELLATAGTGRFAFTNHGNARFAAPTVADAGASLLPLGQADFTLDGRADLLAGDGRSLWLVPQTPAGFLAPLQLFTNNQSGLAIAADFTGDGRADLLRVPQLGNLNADFWVNQSADGGAPFSQTRNAAPNLQLADLARAGDLNGDGRADLVTSAAGQLRVFLTAGATGFNPGPAAPQQNGVIGLAVGELTRDAHRDVAILTPAAVSVLAGDGSGALTAPVVAANAASPLASVEVADLDGDGFGDLALGTGRGLEVLWSTGAGTFSALDVYPVDGFTPSSPASGLQLIDFTGDGRLDVVLSSGVVKPVLVRNGASGRGFERTLRTLVSGGAEFLLTAPLDGDARDDVLVSRRATAISMAPVMTQTRVLRSLADGGFAIGPEDTLTRPDAVADFDQDSNPDVLRLECPAPPLPDGGFNPAPARCFARVDFGAALRFGATGVALALEETAGAEVVLRTADFDADGRPDVLARTRAGFLLFRNLGARQFSAAVVTPFLPAVVDLAVADVDRDGRPDLVALSGASAPRAVYVLHARGPAFSLAPRLGSFDFDTSLAAGFVTNDAFPDLAGSSGVLMTGNGASVFARGTDWRPAPVAANASFLFDSDGDGRAEVVSRSFGSTVFANPDVPPRGFAGRVERFADVTGDGIPDWVQGSAVEVVVGVGRCR